MKAMISQPMQGKTEEQIRNERVAVIEHLVSRGWEVVDTVLSESDFYLCHGDRSLFALGKSIQAMSECEAVYFMSGWQDSHECDAEHRIAASHGLMILRD